MAIASVTKVCPQCGKEHAWTTRKDNRSQANSWEEWAAQQDHLCSDCYAKMMQTKRESEHRAATELGKTAATDLSLTELTGTEKQVAWATAIRGETISKLDISTIADPRARVCITNCISEHTDAKWWIDNRFQSEAHIRSEAEIRMIDTLSIEELIQVKNDLENYLSQHGATYRMFHRDITRKEVAQLDKVVNRIAILTNN